MDMTRLVRPVSVERRPRFVMSSVLRTTTSWHRFLWPIVLLALAYGTAARIGLAYSSIAPNVTLLWAPTGIALFAVLRWGPGLWPAIVLGDLIANASTGAPWWAILGISAGNVAQCLLCAALLRRVLFDEKLGRVRDVLALLSLGTAGAAISATVGPAALALAGNLSWQVYPSVWLQWLMGDATGVVVLTPLLLAWWQPVPLLVQTRSAARRVEAVVLLGILATLTQVVFGQLFDDMLPVVPGYYPSALALFPLAVWAALRFGLRGATLLTLLISAAAVWGTVRGIGPFVDGAQTSSLIRWWVFANVITVTSLMLAATQSERDEARLQAIRDRDFATAVLDAEGALVVVLDADWRITRANRTFESTTSFTQSELQGKRFEQALIPSDQHDKFNGHAEMLRLNLSDSARHESPLRRRGGPPLTVSWTMSVMRDVAGQITHVIVSGVDVSTRVEAASALRQARRELEARVVERTRALADANADLQIQMTERQRLETEIIGISEKTQQRFGQELHDGLGQHLTAAAIQAELLALDLEGAGQEEARQCARGLESLLSDAVSQTRLLARGLFPVELEAGGLMVALQRLADTTHRLVRRPCRLHCPEPVALQDHTVAVHLYRMAQEAVNNAVKHSDRGPIDIELGCQGGMLRLSVCNDLAAPSADATSGDSSITAEEGMGLRIMKHRCHLIGADLSVGRQADSWRMSIAVPDAAVGPGSLDEHVDWRRSGRG